jgi:hypothetical protein
MLNVLMGIYAQGEVYFNLFNLNKLLACDK